MANNESDFTAKLKRLCANRAVIVTVLTLLVATLIIVAVTVSANRTKRPTPADDTTGSVTAKPDNPAIKDETLPVYNGNETKPVGGNPEEPAKFALPVSGKLMKAHDPTIQVYSNTMGDYRVHLGVDIATAAEASVAAVAAGKVERIWEDALMGTCVAIAHEGEMVSIYKNLAKTLAENIAVGATVKSGQTIGQIGDTATLEMADEPHLHFEMTAKGLSVNPLEYFTAAAVSELSKDTAFESSASEVTTAKPADTSDAK